LTEDEKKTQEYDKLAFKLVGYAAAPLMVGYTYYSCTFFSLLTLKIGQVMLIVFLIPVVNYK
jgi:hypothetical protein